jgi:hypothetical protein
MTSNDRFVIRNCINEALIDFTMERSIDEPKHSMINAVVATVADQNYVDLAANVTKVVDGSVRIIAEDQLLTYFDGSLTDFYAVDPGEDNTASWPSAYAIDTNESGAIRLRLRPIPSQVNTITLKVEAMVDEDDIDDFPGWYHGMLRSLATALVCESLALPGAAMHQNRYTERMTNAREQQRGRSGPQHLRERHRGLRFRSPQTRTNF